MKMRSALSIMASMMIMVMLMSVILPSMALGAANEEFKDIVNSYAKQEISALVKEGIISGYADGTFQPQKAITRAELAKILVLSLGLKEEATKAEPFSDVAAASWYRGYVGALVGSGITQGTSATTFSPDAKVTREELIVFFIRALGLESTAAGTPVSTKLSDMQQVSAWAQSQVSLAVQIGFVNGIEGPNGTLLFNPKDKAERQALARLAYAFKTNASTYKTKAKDFVNGQKAESGSEIVSLQAANNTSIEVTFASALTIVNKEDFAFDNDLKVTAAAIKAQSNTVVVLTTSTQASGTSYKLTYKGIASGKAFVGAAAMLGGGGGGFGSIGGGSPTVEQLLASGTPQGEVKIEASGTYGPASGPVTTVQKLIVNPGPAGEVTLRNINPGELEIQSGATSSIKLKQTIITKLRINAINNNGQNVRIEAMDGAVVTDTEVSSQAILESSTTHGTLGKIKLTNAAAGKSLTLRGNIDGEVTVEAPDSQIRVEPPTGGNPLPTVLKNLKLATSASITSSTGTSTQTVSVTAKDTRIAVSGEGELQEIQLPSDSTGTAIEVDATANIKTINAAVPVNVTGDPGAIAKVSNAGAGGIQMDSGLQDRVKIQALLQANQAIGVAASIGSDYTVQVARIDAAEKAIANAKRYGFTDGDFSNLTSYQNNKQFIFEMRDSLNQLSLSYAEGDTTASVTKRPIFPNAVGKDTVVVWSTDRPDILSYWGPLTRPASGAGDATVTITATLYKQAYTLTKTFVVTVKQHDAHVKWLDSLRSDLVLVVFDAPVANSVAADYRFDNGLQVVNATYYPQFPNMVLLNVGEQTAGTIYNLTYKNERTGISLNGSITNKCSATTCPLTNQGQEIPIPGVNVPGSVMGYVFVPPSQGVADITVKLNGTNKETRTNANGFYTFDQVSPGIVYSVTAMKEGYSISTTSDFTIVSGEPHGVNTILLYTIPEAVTGLQVFGETTDSITLLWTPPQNWTGKAISYNVYKDGQKIITSTNQSLQKIDALQAGQKYSFAVEACNDLGCSKQVSVSAQTSVALQVYSVTPYDSVTSQVYSALEKVDNNYRMPVTSQTADSLLIRFKDIDYSPGTGSTPLKGTLDYSNAGVELQGLGTINSEVITLGGVTYLRVAFDTKTLPTLPGLNYKMYNIGGLKYTLNSKTYNVQFIDLVVLLSN
ncbi:S-layer homology domain-containing protein [Paenibacillus sp. GCM10027628]|uniref:S-layer homology domain-containing protein n=1 Tax=Paenibacillus sp. GCM10027628 TaxID=3273413 RepID=UPI00362CA3F7